MLPILPIVAIVAVNTIPAWVVNIGTPVATYTAMKIVDKIMDDE